MPTETWFSVRQVRLLDILLTFPGYAPEVFQLSLLKLNRHLLPSSVFSDLTLYKSRDVTVVVGRLNFNTSSALESFLNVAVRSTRNEDLDRFRSTSYKIVKYFD